MVPNHQADINIPYIPEKKPSSSPDGKPIPNRLLWHIKPR